MRARALLNASIDLRVVVGEHGWWQAEPEANAPGYDPFSPQGSNYNLTVDPSARDPISGTTAHRSGCCEVSRINLIGAEETAGADLVAILTALFGKCDER